MFCICFGLTYSHNTLKYSTGKSLSCEDEGIFTESLKRTVYEFSFSEEGEKTQLTIMETRRIPTMTPMEIPVPT